MPGDESPPNPKRIVEAGYDHMAEGYLSTKHEADAETITALEEMARSLPPGAPVLDLGCGAGIPATLRLAQQGFAVTGVDISDRQLELARKRVPSAAFIKADMASLAFPRNSFDAVTAFYSIIHVPKEEHASLVANISRWLKPSGAFLATWPMSAWEGEEENWEGWGATMWWSHYGQEDYLRMLSEAGFAIASAEVHSGKETWLWVLAKKTDH
jgi:ubiquinone/menaquinone biosynthesis C-methylase UbiE